MNLATWILFCALTVVFTIGLATITGWVIGKHKAECAKTARRLSRHPWIVDDDDYRPLP